MKKIVTVAGLLMLTISLFGLEVDEKELRIDGKTIEFINYTGTHTQVDSVAAIKSIGASLAGAAKTGSAGTPSRYYVMHIVDPEVKSGFDADILVIGKDARVDHINNVRLIIAAYLEKAYAYSEKDARTIAHFVTVYNAVYRKNMDYFSSHYKKAVVEKLDANKAGLALRYDEWPGQSQILIPLSDPRFTGTSSTVDTTSISEKKAEATKSPSDKKIAEEKQAEAEKAQKKATEAQKEATEQGEKAEKVKKEAEKKQEDVSTEKKLAEKKEKEAQDERKNVAADTQRILEEKAAEKKAQSDATIASTIPGYGLKVVDEVKLLSELVLLDLKTSKELRSSAVNTIQGRYLVDADGKLMAIAGTKDGGGVITLVLFDPLSLEVVKQGEDNISAQSLLIKNGEDYYAVVDQGGKYYIGRFNKELKLQAKSSIQVLPYTPITIVDEGIMVQSKDTTLRLIGLKDLIHSQK